MSVPNTYPVPENEALRLKALDAYNIIDTMAENEYDCITRIAAHICNTLVKGEPNVVFYAGAPLITPEGYVLGSICVLDDQVRTLDENQIATMMALSQQVVTQLELRLCPYSIARYENAGLEYSGS